MKRPNFPRTLVRFAAYDETATPVAERNDCATADAADEMYCQTLLEEQRAEAQACEEAKTETQLTPDDVVADGGAMASTSGDETPTERELVQDVVTTNPSKESMESRGLGVEN